MRYLLDTHAVLWVNEGSPKISPRLRDIISSGDCCFSVASLWEIAIKMDIGKLKYDGGFTAFLRDIKSYGFGTLPIREEYLSAVLSLPPIHRDPFDRLIIVTANR